MKRWAGKAWGADFAGRIRSESFRVHSVFRSVCNLQADPARQGEREKPGEPGEPLLSLVAAPEAMGPNALWVESPGFAGFLPPGQPVIFQGQVLHCGGVEIDCANPSNWRLPAWPVPSAAPAPLALPAPPALEDVKAGETGETGAEAGDDLEFANRALGEVRSWLEIQAPGLAPDLTPSPALSAASGPAPGPTPSPGAGGGLVQEIARGLLAEDGLLLQSALRGLVGAGEGLTPSGDDFAAGVLLAYVRGHYWIRHRTGRRIYRRMGCRASTGSAFVSRLPGLVEALLPGTNAISRTMLWYAARGEGAAYLAETAEAIYAGGSAAVNCASRLWHVGASSGRYLLAGVILGSEIFLTGAGRQKSGSGTTNGREDCSQAQYVF